MDSIWLNYHWTISWMRGWGPVWKSACYLSFSHLYSEYAYPGYLKPPAPIWRAIVRSYYLRHLRFYDIFSILASAPKWNDLCIESQTNLFEIWTPIIRNNISSDFFPRAAGSSMSASHHGLQQKPCSWWWKEAGLSRLKRKLNSWTS